MIRFHCPTCQKVLKAPPEKAGAKAACPNCRRAVVVPAPEEPVLEVLPVEDDAAAKRGPPPLPTGPGSHHHATVEGRQGIPIQEVMRQAEEQEDRERVPRFRSWMREQVAAANWTEAYRFARCLLYSVPDDPEALAVKARVEREFPAAVPDDRLVFNFIDLGGTRKVRVVCDCGLKNTYATAKIGQEVRCRDCNKPFVLLTPDADQGGRTADPPAAVRVAAAPARPTRPPRPEPALKECRRWDELASALAGEDEEERAVEVGGPLLDEVRRRLDEHAAAVPHHRVGGFGSRATVLSLTECCVFSISLKAVFETRRLGQGEGPYFGWKIPARECSTQGLDLWDFRYRCRSDATGRSEHVIPASQTIHACDGCRGQGAVACDTCRGGRTVACSSCGGRGAVEGIVRTEQRQKQCDYYYKNFFGTYHCVGGLAGGSLCPRCQGRTYIWYDHPVYGMVPCSACKGQRQVACSTCTGTGQSGQAECERCRGGKQLVRYASVVRTLEPASLTTTVAGNGCDQQVADLLTRRTRFLPLVRLARHDTPPHSFPPLSGGQLAGKVRELLDSFGSRATSDRRMTCTELEVGRSIALKIDYSHQGQRYVAWLLGGEKVVHAPTSPVTDSLSRKPR